MIATHNIKVNGRWIRAGEQYGEPEVQQKPAKEVQKAEEPAAPAEAKKAEDKPKTTSRRKTIK